MKPGNEKIVIKVIGIGRTGILITNATIKNGIKNAQFYAVDIDVEELRNSIATEKLQISTKSMRGLGTGSDLGYGYKLVIETQDKLQQIVEDADLVYIITGLGGITGTGVSPVIAELAKKSEAITIAVVTKPFAFEGAIRLTQFEKGLKELKKSTDLLIVIPNQKLSENIGLNISIIDAFRMTGDIACQIVIQIIMSIYDIFIVNSDVDFDDIKKLLTGKGLAFVGIGEESGENRATRSAQKSISDLGLDNDQLQKAELALVNVIGAPNMQVEEVEEAINSIRGVLNPKADIIWAVTSKGEFAEKIKVFLMVTGFNTEIKY